MNPLLSVKGSLITGFVIAILFAVLAVDGGWNELGLARWLHIIAGISKYIAPRALFWFRWAAVATWITGAWYLGSGFGDAGAFAKAFTLQPGFRTIGVGAWLGTIMLFNVWVLIWPNQKKILGIVPATDEQKAAARKTALYASRANYILSIPMLMCMAGATHGLPF